MEQILPTFSLFFLALRIINDELIFSGNTVLSNVEAPRPEVIEFNNTIYATCEVTPVPDLSPGQPKISGQVLFKQVFPNGTLQVIVNLGGLPAIDPQVRAIHIHQYGDLSQGCVSAGPHYNPQGVDHPGHPGDLGNFESEHGIIRHILKLSEARLFGGQSILGRAVVVHQKEDDLGMGLDEESKRSGNAGKRIAGCVIGISSPRLWQAGAELLREEVKKEGADNSTR
ncbi:extracellular superoxide dismutase [Triplophysa dalaica]|uniref:extracellular superoxide dismutase n=1 Tax=Triplophysa dalaica TaxID=1582913 RepID=UPI0024E004FB|nr:extracellular superoxide dismutase [Triplophysa dalaica]